MRKTTHYDVQSGEEIVRYVMHPTYIPEPGDVVDEGDSQRVTIRLDRVKQFELRVPSDLPRAEIAAKLWNELRPAWHESRRGGYVLGPRYWPIAAMAPAG